jgi:HEAT repeat protein
MNKRESTNASARALYASAFTGEKALPILLKQLADTNAPNRHHAASVFVIFTNLSSNNDLVVTQLVRCLQDHEPRVRDISAYALGSMAARQPVMPSFVIPALTNCLRTNAPALLKQRAAWAIGNYRQDAAGLEPLLIPLTHDTNPDVRSAAQGALRKIAPNGD